MMEIVPREAFLKTGYVPKGSSAEPIRRVLFTKRPLAADMLKIEDSRQGQLETQKALMYARACITEFGDQKRAPFLSELLSLNNADRSLLIDAYTEFLGDTMGDRDVEEIDRDNIRLAFGLEEEEGVYDIVTFCDKGSLLDGHTEAKIERESGGPFEMGGRLLGYDIALLTQSSVGGKLEGPLDIERLKRFDFFDFSSMLAKAAERREFFRRS